MRKIAMSSKFSTPSQKMARGFSMLEMTLAIAIFAVIGIAAIRLFAKHAPLVSMQGNQAGLNIALRGAMAQIEVDGVNAGSGYYQSTDIPDWPIGVTISNNQPPVGTDCHTASNFRYGAACFDQLNIITVDTTTPPSRPSIASTGVGNADTTKSDLYLIPVAPTTPAQLAAKYAKNDEILLLHTILGSKSTMTTASLTAAPAVTGTTVHLVITPTDSSGVYGNGTGTDPLLISNVVDSPVLTSSFSPVADWVLRLSPITYAVDITTNPDDPRLTRQVGSGTPDVIAENIIGFRVGASLRNGTTDQPYNFNSGPSGYNSDWTLIRSIRVSLIARTPPGNDPLDNYTNAFDQGHYRIEGVSVTINPRNLSMTDH
ncbi:MAG TPA: prepilin-type N-terminal cleavage/methylation domain-containing protein [Candidatus Angelobacter sp.]|nr:prepilin-type N-terminal cleavage/methylation domain-containing protein [Candidatus Angelobacter sp.]